MNDKQSLRIGIIALLFIFLSFGVIQYAMRNVRDIHQRWSGTKTILDFRGIVMPLSNQPMLPLPARRRRNTLNNTSTIFISGEIDSCRAVQIIREIKRVDTNAKTKEIQIRLIASGKDMSAILAVYHTIKQCRKPVNIVAEGALSGAVLILASGTPGKRLVTQNAIIIIEQPIFTNEPNKLKKFLLKNCYLRLSFVNFRNNWLNLLAQNTRQPIKLIDKLNYQKKTLSPEKAIEYGFADQIIKDKEDNEKKTKAQKKK